MRGEYTSSKASFSAFVELPPRARRIQPDYGTYPPPCRTTSACAENTSIWIGKAGKSGNYLRVRGEYLSWKHTNWATMELPPRARRIRHTVTHITLDRGTTSACAENTELFVNPIIDYWNYLRVRGEYLDLSFDADCGLELPPRARRIQHYHGRNPRRHGTTSACAENTAHHHPGRKYSGNYLRVRGEYTLRKSTIRAPRELPPRARRIPYPGQASTGRLGTTSACAENTLNELGLL